MRVIRERSKGKGPDMHGRKPYMQAIKPLASNRHPKRFNDSSWTVSLSTPVANLNVN